jgi:hypothetical protein
MELVAVKDWKLWLCGGHPHNDFEAIRFHSRGISLFALP